VQINDRFLEDYLIHRSGKNEPMRSKSEVIIADSLAETKIEYFYEQTLTGSDGYVRYPDFTIEDADSGNTYYWEHLGLLENEQYKTRWERKLAWYREQKILPREEGGGEKGTLIMTRDAPNGGINSRDIKLLIKEFWG
jgi:predicted nuclease of restriction endonuclease-like RecB superfamily